MIDFQRYFQDEKKGFMKSVLNSIYNYLADGKKEVKFK